MEKVESSNRGDTTQAPIFRDHGKHLMRQEEGTGGVSGTSDNTAGSSSSSKGTGGSGTKQNNQQAAIAEVNNTAPETAEATQSPIDEIKELENEKTSIKDNQKTTQQAATEAVKPEPKKTVSNKGAEKAEELDSKIAVTRSKAPHELGFASSGKSTETAIADMPSGIEKAEASL